MARQTDALPNVSPSINQVGRSSGTAGKVPAPASGAVYCALLTEKRQLPCFENVSRPKVTSRKRIRNDEPIMTTGKTGESLHATKYKAVYVA